MVSNYLRTVLHAANKAKKNHIMENAYAFFIAANVAIVMMHFITMGFVMMDLVTIGFVTM